MLLNVCFVAKTRIPSNQKILKNSRNISEANNTKKRWAYSLKDYPDLYMNNKLSDIVITIISSYGYRIFIKILWRKRQSKSSKRSSQIPNGCFSFSQ